MLVREGDGVVEPLPGLVARGGRIGIPALPELGQPGPLRPHAQGVLEPAEPVGRLRHVRQRLPCLPQLLGGHRPEVPRVGDQVCLAPGRLPLQRFLQPGHLERQAPLQGLPADGQVEVHPVRPRGEPGQVDLAREDPAPGLDVDRAGLGLHHGPAGLVHDAQGDPAGGRLLGVDLQEVVGLRAERRQDQARRRRHQDLSPLPEGQFTGLRQRVLGGGLPDRRGQQQVRGHRHRGESLDLGLRQLARPRRRVGDGHLHRELPRPHLEVQDLEGHRRRVPDAGGDVTPPGVGVQHQARRIRDPHPHVIGQGGVAGPRGGQHRVRDPDQHLHPGHPRLPPVEPDGAEGGLERFGALGSGLAGAQGHQHGQHQRVHVLHSGFPPGGAA